jgi:hypothetical protein
VNRHDIVRPTGFAIDRTHYTKTSLLTLMLRKLEDGTRCRSCRALLVPGELYARGAEASSNLCLECVEPMPKKEAA